MNGTEINRAAASECVNLFARVLGVQTPEAKELALIVAARLLEIDESGAGKPTNQQQLDQWVTVARKLHEERQPAQEPTT